MGEEGSGGILGVSRKRIDFYKSAIFLNKQFKLFAEKKKTMFNWDRLSLAGLRERIDGPWGRQSLSN